MDIVFYVAIARNGVIGNKGDLPWRLSTDLKRFKATTMGKPILMGRKTWESFPKRPLPGRLNIVVTRNSDLQADGAEIVGSVEEGIARAARLDPTAAELCVIGGGNIYRQLMDRVDRLCVTHVLADIEGDTVFPVIDDTIWKAVHEESFPSGERDDFATRYAVYERRDG